MIESGEQISMLSVDSIIRKKNILLNIILDFYEVVSKKRGEKFSVTYNRKKLNDYKIELIKENKRKINKKAILLKKLRNKDNSKQENINVVSSKTAWDFISHKIICLIDDQTLSRGDFKSCCQGLKKLRENTENTMEKLAITIYILRINKFYLKSITFLKINKFYLKSITWVAPEDLNIKIFTTINPKFFNADSIKKEFLFDIEDDASLIDIKKECFYMMSLAETINNEEY